MRHSIRSSGAAAFPFSCAFLSLVLPVAAAVPSFYQLGKDWLVDGESFKASVTETEREVVLDNGLVRRVIRKDLGATAVFENRMTGQALIRAVKPEAFVTLEGKDIVAGGAKGQRDQAFIVPAELSPDPAALVFKGVAIGPIAERFAWARVRHVSPNAVWPPKGRYARLDYADGVSVHYEIYDGLPLLAKWLTVSNATDKAVILNRFALERLAVVEAPTPWDNQVTGMPLVHSTALQAVTEMFDGIDMTGRRGTVRWLKDKTFTSQVDYSLNTPCTLEIAPYRGPEQTIAPGGVFTSFRAFELLQDSTDAERRGLAVRRMFRTLSPWCAENPLMFHLLASDDTRVKKGIDQAAEIGFEMVILSFGSGFNAENDSPGYIAHWKELADYAHSKGIEIGSYSLLASRSVGGGNDVVSAKGESPAFGQAPALTSEWGIRYFAKLRALYEKTGFNVLENDGSYPGDWDVTPRPPLQKGLLDSQWAQWCIIRDFYQWCRGRGVYLNIPDTYFLVGGTKCAMGYREDNWSLPRAEQVLHTRQNIYDGTWDKTPSMGWMFVPLAQYHGGGAAATIEPLDEHLDHYRLMLLSNLACGVQACYRGPRLYDTDRVRDMLKREVGWFKEHRDILESDIIHLRRADGQDWDGVLHVNPALKERAMLCVFNPTDAPVTRSIKVPLYYAGLEETVVTLTIPPHDFVWKSF